MDINSKGKVILFLLTSGTFLPKKSAHLPIGAHSTREIPVPIPNTEVKPSSGDYTAQAGN